MVVDLTKLPKPKTTQEQKKLDQQVASTRSVVFKMELLRGGKYRMLILWPGHADQHDEGVWKVKGDRLFRTLLKIDGRPKNPFTSEYRIDVHGKKLIGVPKLNKASQTIFVRG